MRLRIAPSWQCWPLWDDETGENLHPRALSLPGELMVRILDWDDAFQEIFDDDDPLHSGFPSGEAEAEWRREGRAIADALSAAGFDLAPHQF